MQQPSLFNSEPGTQNSEPQPVTCLGIEFPSDEARRQHFTGLLRERLRDPEFRKIEGFPIGSDEDILNLSDPPYYTACPNPWIADFITQWEKEKKVARVREWLSMKSVGQAFRPANANLLEEALWFFHQERYLLDAYVIMPDHVHLLIRPTQGNTLAKIMQGLKGYTAMELNKIMKRKGSFWQDENFDHLIRNGADWLDKFEYIHNNPVKAGLVENPEDYPYSSLVTLHAEGRLESLPHTQLYHREHFAADVSEGKNDPIYNAHSYHTKVPHKAIMRYILHYTQPGDIVFDGFCGTGMTGVAAQMCGDREAVMSLGYQVKTDGIILQEATDEDGKKIWAPFSKLGSRRVVLNDLSPAATFMACNFNAPLDVSAFQKEVDAISQQVEAKCGWMYETLHSDGKSKGKVNFVIWSDVFVCPECTNEVIFWNAAVDENIGTVLEDFRCPDCKTMLSKEPANQKREATKPVSDRRPVASKVERSWVSVFDNVTAQAKRLAKQTPVLINYTYRGKRYQKAPDSFDRDLFKRIEDTPIDVWIPNARMPEGKESRRNDSLGMTHVHLYYTKRNLLTLAAFWQRANKPELKFLLTSLMFKSSHLCGPLMSNYFAEVKGNSRGGWVGKDRSGTLYCPSIHSKVSIFPQITSRSRSTAVDVGESSGFVINTSSASSALIPENSQDYVFIDPPFGSNINYSEMSFLWEAWFGVTTNIKPEAIENSTQGKGLNEYRQLMTEGFKKVHYILKPGRWVTVEFSNTKAAVWNNIQTALTEAGFIVANVSALSKKQGSINAYTTPTAVKQDLVISAYKPNGGFEERFHKEAQTEEGVWDFVRTHLKYLPVTKQQGVLLLMVPERDPRILFDQMIAFYVRKGYPVPISSQEFQIGLAQRFIERDGMYFLPDQVAEYDRKKMTSGIPQQLSLFVSDEASSIQWLRQLIREKPQTFSDINPQFMQQLGGWRKNEAQLDLRELLNQNFLCYDGKGSIPAQIVSWMMKSSTMRELISAEVRSAKKKTPAHHALRTSPRSGESLVRARSQQGGRPGETAREGAAQGVRGVQRGQKETQGLPPGSCACGIQESLAGTRLRRHRRRGRQDTQQRPGRRSQTAHVVRPGSNAAWVSGE